MKTGLFSTKNLVRMALLSAISTVLYLIEMPVVPGFGHLKLDLSDIPAVAAGLLMGAPAGIVVEAIKNLLHLFRTSTVGIGELVNFIIGTAMVATLCGFYSVFKRAFRIYASYTLAAIITAAVVIITGYAANAVLFPLYMYVMGNPQLPREAFITYIWSTTTLNAAKSAVTLLPFYALINFIERFKARNG